MTNLEGQTFAGYEIISKLGQGGMGAVYKARQLMLNRLVALKVMAEQLSADPDYVARFVREASAAANLNHPNMVQVYTAGEKEGIYYIAMEFVEGESLRKRLDRLGRITPNEAVAVTVYVAQALQYAWNKSRLIHRDIKPDNIFLSDAGEVKVGDLGLAKSVGAETTELTQSGMTMGSPHYISPEQAQGAKAIDFRADIYSLGCTLYHMLTGRTPYSGDSSMAIILKHVNEPPPAIFRAWPTCPMPLGMLVGRMLAKDRNARPQSYEQLLAELLEVHEKLKNLQSVRAVAVTPTAQQPASTTPAAGTKTATKASTSQTAEATVPSGPIGKRRNLKTAGIAFSAAAVVALAGLLLWSPWKSVSPDAGEKPAPPTASEPASSLVMRRPPEVSADDLRQIEDALPTKAATHPRQPRRLAVFWRCEGFRHDSGIAAAAKAIELMGKKTGAYETDFSNDYSLFDTANLARYDAVVFNNTCKLSFPDTARRQALLDFVRSGKGIVGIHAATDNFYEWPEGAAMMGGMFDGHPWTANGTWAFKPDDPGHVLNRAFGGKGFKLKDEIYQMKEPYTRAGRQVLLTLDLSDSATGRVKKGVKRTDGDFAVAWIKPEGNGRVFYCGLGHAANVFQEPAVLQFYLDGIQYALDDLKTDAAPAASAADSALRPPPFALPVAVAPFDATQARQHQEAWAKHLGVPIEMTNSIGMKFILIPPGEFDMGSSPEVISTEMEEGRRLRPPVHKFYFDRVPTEGPRHRVRITKPFYLGVCEVTQGEFQTVTGGNPSGFSATGSRKSLSQIAGVDASRHPVETVSWDEAKQFLDRMTSLPLESSSRRSYRLPTEAEWEYACRAGTTTRWWSGDDPESLRPCAWFKGNAGGTTHPVGQTRPNPWGLFDMHGNVFEWCSDRCNETAYEPSEMTDPQGPAEGRYYITRGGCYERYALGSRSAYRGVAGGSPWPVRSDIIGFRAVCEVNAQAGSPASLPRQPAGTAGASANLRYGLYLHFDISTFTGYQDMSRVGKAPPSLFAPKALDMLQWARVAREAGATFAVLTAKHEAGFCLWPAKDSDYHVGLSPVKTDIVGEFVAACKAEGLKVGVHYSVPDARVEGQVKFRGPVEPAHFAIIKKHLAELTANYPDILVYVVDCAHRFSPEQFSEVSDLLKQSNPQRLILQTAANERRGRIPSISGLQEHNAVTVNRNWFWSPNASLTPASKLYQEFQKSAQQDVPFLVNVGPDRDGRIPDQYVAVLMELKGMMGGATQAAPAPAQNRRLQWLGYCVYDKASAMSEVAAYSNFVLLRKWDEDEHRDQLVEAAQKVGLKVVLAIPRKKNWDDIKDIAGPLITKHRDTVVAICWYDLYYQGGTPEQLAEDARRVREAFPQLQRWAEFVEKPRGKVNTKPIPPEINVVVVNSYFATTPGDIRSKANDVLAGWVDKAKRRPVLFQWSNWQAKGPGLVPSTSPATMQMCATIANEFGLAGLVFDSYDNAPDDAGGLRGIETNPVLINEIKVISKELGFAK